MIRLCLVVEKEQADETGEAGLVAMAAATGRACLVLDASLDSMALTCEGRE